MHVALLVVLSLVAFHPQESSSLITPLGTQEYTPEYIAEYDLISINGYVFNPLEASPEIPAGLNSETGYYLVKFNGPIYESMKNAVRSQGIELLEYIPFNVFVAKLSPEQKLAVSQLSFISWIGDYVPAYKISPDFVNSRTKDHMNILFWNNVDMKQAISSMEQMGCEILNICDAQYVKYIEVRIAYDRINELSRTPEIMYIEPWYETVLFNEQAQWVTQTWKNNDRKIWAKGLDGTGQVVNTSDTGILTSHNLVRDPAVPISGVGQYPTHRKIIAYRIPGGSSATFGDNAAGVWHGTHTCGTICGDDSYVGQTVLDDGMPPKAKMYFMDIGTTAGGLSVPANYDSLWYPPYVGNAGGSARISSNSWGSSGNTYTAAARMIDVFMWNRKDFLIIFSAGNSGPAAGSVSSPSTAKDCITAGACGNSFTANSMATFSSRGPTSDNRIKPTVTAPGVSLRSSIGPNNDSYSLMSGTSMSSPCIGGNAALVRDYFASGFYPTGIETPANAWSYISAAMVKAILVNSALPDIQGSTIPDNNTGWGRICVDEALFVANDIRKLAVWDDTTGLSTGQFREYTVTVNNQSEPLKVALVWTDYFAATGANPALINNLDLRVTSPSAALYLGNVYSGGQSATGGTADARNVEENVRRNVPETGTWTIRVNGTAVPQGTRQAFAVVVTGGMGALTTPVLNICGKLLADPAPGGNNDGRWDPGETVYLTDTLYNQSAAGVTTCTGVIRTNSAYITRLDSVGTFGNIPVGSKVNNGGSRFRMSAAASTPEGTSIPFTLHLTGGGGYSQDIEFNLMVGSSGLEIIWGPKQVAIAPGDTHFLYGAAYNPNTNELMVTNFYERKIYRYTSDSFATYLGYINAPDTMGTDIKYCAYDNTYWFAGCNLKRVSKINTSGTVLRFFTNPASTYPIGIGWLEPQRLLYLSDRLTGSPSSYIYRTDTLGTWSLRIDVPMTAWNATRCLAVEPHGIGTSQDTTLLLIYTSFNSAGTLDSTGLYELDREYGDVIQRVLFPGWNVRGVEYDPRDGNYWVTIAQSPDRSIVKIRGFYGVTPGVGENRNYDIQRGVSLAPSMPNPFSKTVKFTYSIADRQQVKLNLYDVSGRLVKTMVNQVEDPGIKTIKWDGLDNNGKPISSGVYFYQLETEQRTITRKLVHAR
ncbi:hypothetical protein A2Y85_05975 [candidate division WOR-3 bacterium RBG_13_43_14]|uniref:FlgD Ig-like domain-containing protein n=1 Tax=candidate division WOR-3 bacterium RBG_13_43_14 TaxID=1802590 RepID=A0A1F4U834_UNCW3|nr:MAG: hypothetical protein A2Y85_05975 [candidate division WOR-3 bacterium RBG_13_43_14]